MKVRLFSDIHLEFSNGEMDVPIIEDEKNIILVLAGDICVGKKPDTYVSFLRSMCSRHKIVIMVPGNHEYYHGSLINVLDKIRSEVDQPNFNLVNNKVIEIDNVAFICATLWTNFDKQNPVAMYYAPQMMCDYKYIRHGSVAEPYKYKLRAMDVYQEHMVSKAFIFDSIKEYKEKGFKTFIVTHHSMSAQSIAPKFKNDQSNPYFVSHYDNKIFDAQPDVCVHGHTHTKMEFTVGNTRFYCNPRGYFGHEIVEEFDPNLLIEV